MQDWIRLDNNQSSYANYLKTYKKESYKNFIINVDSSNIMNLQYFILLLQSLKNKNTSFNFDLLIEPSITDKEAQKSRDKDRAQITDYLACFRNTLFNKPIFSIGDGAFKNKWLQYRSESYGRIIPFIPVNDEIYEFLSDRVEKIFSSSITGTSRKHFDVSYKIETKTISRKITKKFIIQTKGNFEVNDARNVLYNACINYLFSSDDRSQSSDFFSFIESRISEYTSPRFYNKVKDISVLAFLIFSAHNRFNLLEGLDNITNSAKIATYNTDKLSHLLPNEKDDDDILICAMDMADGLLQLIENVVFHAGSDNDDRKGTGLLSFRIFKKEQSTFDDYLKPRYIQYFEGHDSRLRIAYPEGSREPVTISSLDQLREYTDKGLNELTRAELESHIDNLSEIERRKNKRGSVPFYLEVKLLDCSGKNMCTVFVQNHKNDKYFHFENVNVSTLFNPTKPERDNWLYFNSNPDNVVHHYGLQLFDALVQSIDGCFVAQSIAEGETIEEKSFYSTSGDLLPGQNPDEYFRGTQYSILLPFYKRVRKDYSFVNTNVEYPLPQTDYHIIDKSSTQMEAFIKLLSLFGKQPFKTQKQKNEYIAKLHGKMPKQGVGKVPFDVLIFDSEDLNIHNIEVFIKSLIQYIATNMNKEINIAITNCGEDMLKQLIRIFAVFYDRTGNNIFMRNTQIYLCGKDTKDEFLLAGSNLKDTLVAQIKLDVARGITRETQTGTLAFLLDMLERRPGESTGKESLRYVPFDLLVKYNVSVKNQGFPIDKAMSLTVFEKNVLDVLASDVQDRNPGCKIAPNHMRIGSKIHVDSFYEALVLFSNNYYTGRFAWLLMKVLQDKLKLRPTLDAPFLFIGYETYSEMLLRDLCKLYGDDLAKYCVFEYGTRDMSGKKASNRFRNVEDLGDRIYTQIYVVPINSTLSTFNKLEAEFHRKRKDQANSSATYLGVIQTIHPLNDKSTAEEKKLLKKFFGNVDPIKRTIESKLINPTSKTLPIKLPVVHYLFCVPAKWSDPLLCRRCYPEIYLDEEPLVETDKTSVIPAQLYGLKSGNKADSKSMLYKHNGSIGDLNGCIRYGHTYRGSNHFQYYVETDKYFRKVASEKCEAPISPWLKEVSERLLHNSSYTLRYDIIVYPEHYSNAGFVTLVNDEVFKGASLIIGINFGKEFRDNFKAKHSDLTSIYSNLRNQNCEAEINFHFVDDTIIHGSSFTRVKSLARSLFPTEAYFENSKVKINLFKSVILLINRNSNDSIMNYITFSEDFHVFLNLNISSIRTHDNACILCQEASDNGILRKRAALNDLSKRFSEKEKLTREDDVFNTKNEKEKQTNEAEAVILEEKMEEKENRGFLRLRYTHILNNKFSKLPNGGKNIKIYALISLIEEILNELNDNRSQDIDVIICYIVVVSTPFLSFRKSILEAAFDLILLLFEIVLDEKTIREDAIQRIVKKDDFTAIPAAVSELNERKLTGLLDEFIYKVHQIIENPAKHRDLTKALIKQSVLLKSNYIIRIGNIIRLLKISSQKNFNNHTKFDDYYLFYVKKLISSGTDEAKAMYLEYLLITGKEYDGNDNIGKIEEFEQNFTRQVYEVLPENLSQSLSDLLRNLYLENTQIIFDAAHDLYKDDCEKSPVETTDIYYLENYKKMLKWNNEDEASISQALKNLVKILCDEPKADPNGVLGYFSKLAKTLAVLISASLTRKVTDENKDDPIICFLGERTEPVLILDEANGNIIRREDQKVLDCFAISNDSLACEYKEDNTDDVTKIIEASQDMVNDKDGFVLSTYNQSRCKYYLFNLGGNFREHKYPFEGLAKIRMAIYFKESYSDYQRLKAIRYLLAFNHQISDKIDDCLKGDLLSEELRSLATKKQMQKARAGDHFDEDITDDYSPKLFAESIFLWENRREGFNYSDSEAVYGYFVNSTMGRINIKLLAESNNKWNEELADNDSDEQIIERLYSRLASVNNITRKDLVRFCGKDKEGNIIILDPTNLKDYFMKEFVNRTLLRNITGDVPRFDYFVSIVAELINSVEKHGEESEPDIYEVILEVDRYGNFCVSNRVPSGFTMKSIMDGLLRKHKGISLATTCGFFDFFYSKGDQKEKFAPRVKIYKENNILHICLPLFNN